MHLPMRPGPKTPANTARIVKWSVQPVQGGKRKNGNDVDERLVLVGHRRYRQPTLLLKRANVTTNMTNKMVGMQSMVATVYEGHARNALLWAPAAKYAEPG